MGIGAVLGAAAQVYTAYRQHKNAKEAKANVQNPISWSEATQRATDLNDATYDQRLRSELDLVKERNISHGFFGQLPGAALESSTALGVEEARQNAINNTASAMVGNSQNAYADQMRIALQAQQQADNSISQAFQAAANIPASFDFGGFGGGSSASAGSESGSAAAVGEGMPMMFGSKMPGLEQPISQFPSEQSNADPYFDSFYRRLKGAGGGGGSYTNPYGG